MASSLLHITEQPSVVQSGVAFQIATARLYTKESTSSDARLGSVSAGTTSTIVNINNYGIRDYPVVNDTPAPFVPSASIILAYLYGGVVSAGGSKIKRWDGSQWKDISAMVVFK